MYQLMVLEHWTVPKMTSIWYATEHVSIGRPIVQLWFAYQEGPCISMQQYNSMALQQNALAVMPCGDQPDHS